MGTFTVKNIPTDTYEELKRLAKANRRSINSEIILSIERAVHSRRIDPDEIVARARALREKTAGYEISDAEFTRAKEEGRL